MPDLVAQGNNTSERWRRALPPDEEISIGRGSCAWLVPWDQSISREHARLMLVDDRLKVEKIDSARNPIFFQGQPLSDFFVSSGEHFVIGNTTFTYSAEKALATLDLPSPIAEQTFDHQYLREIRFRDADRRIAVLGQLPDIISSAANESDLNVRLVNVLLSGVRYASTAAIVSLSDPSDPNSQINVRHWDRRRFLGADFNPSESLMRRALEKQETVLHVWNKSETGGTGNGEWAYVTPLPESNHDGWLLYICGDFGKGKGSTDVEVSDSADLRDDIKFTELIASTLANLRQIKKLERSHAGLRSFFSPVVLDALGKQDPDEVLAPRQCKVSVLFSDLRGFSSTSELMADDLLELLDRVSRALGITTRNILAHRGVVGDFHGDAAMGFWGWPLDEGDAIEKSCMAALDIYRQLQDRGGQADHPLKGFQMGLGVASGSAVAGKIGTSDQVKVTVFGPVVNLASRLETMTRILRAPVLIDEATADFIRKNVSPDTMRVRAIAVVQPYGIEANIRVNQLLPPEAEYPQLSNEHVAAYETALDQFVAGDWESAFQSLHHVPADDQVKDFLTVYIAQHNRSAPKDWSGVIRLDKK